MIRPTYLNLLKIFLPVTGWISIMHRITGMTVFICVPGLLMLLQMSLASVEQFEMIKATLTKPPLVFLLMIVSGAFVYHLLAGLRHIIMDFGLLAASLPGARRSGLVVMAASILVLSLFGFFL